MDESLVRICDLAGRLRGTGFLAYASGTSGTLLTSHEAVDGPVQLVLHAHGGQTGLVEAPAITPLPELGLALVATAGLAVPPLPVAVSGPAHRDRRVRLRARIWTDAAISGTVPVTSTATDRFHLLEEASELAAAGPEALFPHLRYSS
ncbi:MAG: hypothetical protein QOI83_2648, partial [Streptomycetaceae bacterium]|nr:hypothetical protein [Streptomycetaceae bacterium]